MKLLGLQYFCRQLQTGSKVNFLKRIKLIPQIIWHNQLCSTKCRISLHQADFVSMVVRIAFSSQELNTSGQV